MLSSSDIWSVIKGLRYWLYNKHKALPQKDNIVENGGPYLPSPYISSHCSCLNYNAHNVWHLILYTYLTTQHYWERKWPNHLHTLDGISQCCKSYSQFHSRWSDKPFIYRLMRAGDSRPPYIYIYNIIIMMNQGQVGLFWKRKYTENIDIL